VRHCLLQCIATQRHAHGQGTRRYREVAPPKGRFGMSGRRMGMAYQVVGERRHGTCIITGCHWQGAKNRRSWMRQTFGGQREVRRVCKSIAPTHRQTVKEVVGMCVILCATQQQLFHPRAGTIPAPSCQPPPPEGNSSSRSRESIMLSSSLLSWAWHGWSQRHLHLWPTLPMKGVAAEGLPCIHEEGQAVARRQWVA